jgi:hypothetical protein
MKTRHIIPALFALTAILLFIGLMGCEDVIQSPEKESIFSEDFTPLVVPITGSPSTPISFGGIIPYIIPYYPETRDEGGNRTCAAVGYAFFGDTGYYDSSSARINYDVTDDEYDADFPTGVSVTYYSETKLLDWTSTFGIGAVIVKGGDAANVYVYEPQWLSDQGLGAPPTQGGPYADLSNITFCWNPVPPECEWIGETAWAANGEVPGELRYNISKNSRGQFIGNWATFVEYEGEEKTVTLFAGQTMIAGTVKFEPANIDDVKITITLNEGWRLEEDEEGEIIGEAVKIQGYNDSPQSYENPAPGLFTTYKGTELVGIIVPEYNFYGVHLNVEWEYCP